ncbi:MAG: hypothetical protein J6J18_11740 [Oscillospiraceae bacterium]|nr:hypothetical protein [Oscillospiraceae bacterium]
MELINILIWFAAAALALFNAFNLQMNGVWVLIAVVFAINGVIRIIKYVKGRKKPEEE